MALSANPLTALPLAWWVEAGPANLGFTVQKAVLEPVRAWLPAGAEALLSADRFYPSMDLLAWLHAQPGWHDSFQPFSTAP